MKKAAALVMAAALMCTLAFTAAGRVDFRRFNDCSAPGDDPDHTAAYGWVAYSPTASGRTKAPIQLQLQILDGADDWEYTVRLGNPGEGKGTYLGTFMTNGVGSGSFHLDLPVSDLEGTRINIWDESDSEPVYHCKLLHTPRFEYW